jgi:hypothetical protein
MGVRVTESQLGPGSGRFCAQIDYNGQHSPNRSGPAAVLYASTLVGTGRRQPHS